MAERCILALVFEHGEHIQQQRCGVGVDHIVPCGAHIVVIWVAVAIRTAAVGLAGGHAVAEHFSYIADRHFQAGHTVAGLGGIVDPIFQVMLVAALVMQPGGGVAFVLAFAVVRAVGTEIVFCAHEKFDGGIFTQVVGQALSLIHI